MLSYFYKVRGFLVEGTETDIAKLKLKQKYYYTKVMEVFKPTRSCTMY